MGLCGEEKKFATCVYCYKMPRRKASYESPLSPTSIAMVSPAKQSTSIGGTVIASALSPTSLGANITPKRGPGRPRKNAITQPMAKIDSPGRLFGKKMHKTNLEQKICYLPHDVLDHVNRMICNLH